MMQSNPLDRRTFLELALGAAGGVLVEGRTSALFAQTPSPPDNLRIVMGSAKTLLRAGDLRYRGMWRFPNSEAYTFAEGPLTFRYVNGERRWLMIPRKSPYALVELAEPSRFGDSPEAAPDMVEVRGWADVFNITNSDANGFVVGGLWWDHAQNVLWYTVYPFYSPQVYPFIGATRLLDNGTTAKYGMWSYAGPGSTYKQVTQWIVPIPPSAQSTVGGRQIAIGAGVMSVAAGANFGPGLSAMTLPGLSSTSLVPVGVPLMGYNSTVQPSWPDFYCKREPDYSVIKPSDTLANPNGSVGYWAASLDAVSGYAWIETPSKQAIVCLGRRGSGRMWYGLPDAYGNGTLVDGAQYANGFHAETYSPAMWIFDPEDLKRAATNSIKPWNVGFKERANWKQLWPSIPARPEGIWTPGGQPSTASFDADRQQLFWMLPLTYNPDYSRMPTVQVWDVP
jgi:hypothetical protein